MNNPQTTPPGPAVPPPPPKAASVPPPPPPKATPGAVSQQTGGTAANPITEKLAGLKPYWQTELTKIHESNGNYKGKVNLPAICFGVFWAFTKGLVVNGIIMLLISISIALFVPFIPGIIVGVYYGIRGNWLVYEKIVLGKQPVL